MTRRLLLGLLSLCALAAPLSAAEPADKRCYEMRTYFAAPSKLDALHARFRDHTTGLFTKHGITNVGYWVPVENPDRKLIYIISFPDRAARESSFKAFLADPAWVAAHKASEADGKLVDKIESRFLSLTDFSPELKPGSGAPSRVYELRTYTTGKNLLPNLLDRFRNHTVAFFSKHGMKNFGYWTPSAGEPGAEYTLIYLLIHDSAAAQAASFAAFRADPEWVKAKAASEAAAGGSLTVPDGVKSVTLVPTDYSPAK